MRCDCSYRIFMYFQDHKAQYEKLIPSCSFSTHKAHRIIRRIIWSKT